MAGKNPHKPEPVGTSRERGKKYPCGVCGQVKRMTKAHVPPQVAGNSTIITYEKMMSKDSHIRRGKPMLGGVHFRGQCDTCNSQIGSLYDNAYADLAAIVRPSWVKDWTLTLPSRVAVADGCFRPGAAVRSLLLGLCAFAPWVQSEFPAFPLDLLAGKSVPLPGDLRLYVALSRGRTARTSGSFTGFYLMGPKARHAPDGLPIGINAVGSCYFPPLAWELVHEDHCMLPGQGWVDVSSWPQIDPGEEHQVHEYFRDLPIVAHPRHTPADYQNWGELYADGLAAICESMDVEGGVADKLTTRMILT